MKIVVLATNNCMVSAVYGLLDVFFAANFCIEKRYGKGVINEIDCQIVTINDQAVAGYNGIQIMPTKLLNNTDTPDIVIVSSLAEVVVDCCEEAVDFSNKAEITSWLSSCHKKGSIMASYCTGAFLLASVGVLRGKTATTHWRSADLFRRVFPYVKLDSEQLIVDNGDVICSGGAMSYIDLALHLVDKHVGKDVTSDCAKLLVFDPVRQKQSPYVTFKSYKKHEDKPILKAQEWLETHFHHDISIHDLADKVGLGSRTFKRRFKLATNENPINYLQRIRVEQAKNKLEKTTESINNIIWSVGYEDISSFRQLFKRFTGLTPKDYRYKFS
jgi:transcriptional regulator GlxA family with amidase domain